MVIVLIGLIATAALGLAIVAIIKAYSNDSSSPATQPPSISDFAPSPCEGELICVPVGCGRNYYREECTQVVEQGRITVLSMIYIPVYAPVYINLT